MFRDIFTLSGRRGRLNRLRFFLFSLGLVVSVTIVLLLLLEIPIRAYTYESGIVPVAFGITDISELEGKPYNLNFIQLGINIILYLLKLTFILILFWGMICLSTKRLHDLNKSGWLVLLGFIPIVNLGLLVYLLFFPGTKGPNKFGPDLLGKSSS